MPTPSTEPAGNGTAVGRTNILCLTNPQRKKAFWEGAKRLPGHRAKYREEPEGIKPDTNVQCAYYSVKPRNGLLARVSFLDETILLDAGLSFTFRDI